MTNVTTTELETALQDLATSLGLSVKEYVEGGFLDLTTYGTDKSAINARLDSLEIIDGSDGIETLAEKVASLNELLTDNDTLATDILNRIATNSTAIGSVQTEITDYKVAVAAAQAVQDGNIASLQSGASTLAQTVADNKTAGDAADVALAGRVTDTEADLAILNGDSTVVGSVAKAVADEAAARIAADAAEVVARDAAIAAAKASAIETAGTSSDAGDAALQTQIDNLGTAGTAATAAITDIQAELDSTQAAIGLNTDGSFTPVDGSDTLEEYIQDVAGDANTVRKAIRKVARKSKQADQALAATIAQEVADREAADTAETAARVAADTVLDNKIVAETADRTAADAAIQAQLDSLGVSGSGSIGDVETRLDVVEGDLNDTTDGQGQLVKGVKSRLTDVEGQVASNAATTATQLAQLDTDLKAYSDTRDLKASEMDVYTIGNKFRQALGLADVIWDGNTGGGL